MLDTRKLFSPSLADADAKTTMPWYSPLCIALGGTPAHGRTLLVLGARSNHMSRVRLAVTSSVKTSRGSESPPRMVAVAVAGVSADVAL